jgi:hypothetical protein
LQGKLSESFEALLCVRVAARSDQLAPFAKYGFELSALCSFDLGVMFVAWSVSRVCPDQRDDEKATNQDLACLQNNPPPNQGTNNSLIVLWE